MPDAKGSAPTPPIRSTAEKVLRSLIYYSALLSCVVIAITVSYTVILQMARDSVQDQVPDQDALREARALSDYVRELSDISNLLADVAKEGHSPPSDAFSRRLNDLRRRMRQFPHDSDALNTLMQTGDRLVAWAAIPGDERARDRAQDALNQAETAVKQRVKVLDVAVSR